jgi:hypothetical protein
MQLGIISSKFSNSGVIIGFLAAIFLVLWGISRLWLRNADLRPVTETAPASGINVCMDRYARVIDDKLPQLNVLWSTYSLCDAITTRNLLYEEQVIRNENFVFQRYENTIIMLMVAATRSRVLGAHFGLTPRKYQSGETDVTGAISRVGDAMVRMALYEAAHIMLSRVTRFSE